MQELLPLLWAAHEGRIKVVPPSLHNIISKLLLRKGGSSKFLLPLPVTAIGSVSVVKVQLPEMNIPSIHRKPKLPTIPEHTVNSFSKFFYTVLSNISADVRIRLTGQVPLHLECVKYSIIVCKAMLSASQLEGGIQLAVFLCDEVIQF